MLDDELFQRRTAELVHEVAMAYGAWKDQKMLEWVDRFFPELDVRTRVKNKEYGRLKLYFQEMSISMCSFDYEPFRLGIAQGGDVLASEVWPGAPKWEG